MWNDIKIRCACCCRPVERQEVWRFDAKCSWTVRVFCHGETDECTITDNDIGRMTRLCAAEAFGRLAMTYAPDIK